MRQFLFYSSFSILIIFILSDCKNSTGPSAKGGDVIYKAGDHQTFHVGNTSFKMIFVPGKSTFTVFNGSTDTLETNISHSSWIGETEVTYDLWYTVYTWATSSARGTDRYFFANAGTRGSSGSGSGQQPVTNISWRDAIVWCNAATEWYNDNDTTGGEISCTYFGDPFFRIPYRDARGGSYGSSINPNHGSIDYPYIKSATYANLDMANCNSTGFRMPVTNEYFLAARYIADLNNDGDILDASEYYPGNHLSGADTRWDVTSGGTDIDSNGVILHSADVAVFDTSDTAPVKSKLPNKLGVYDICGNVAEWCFDWYDESNGYHPGYGGYYSLTGDNLIVGKLGNLGYPYNKFQIAGFRLIKNVR